MPCVACVRFLARCLLAALLLPLLGPGTVQAVPDAQALSESRDIIQHNLSLKRSRRPDGSWLGYRDDLRRFYHQRDYRPFWFGPQGPRPALQQLLEVLAVAAEQGLSLEPYLPALKAHRQPPADALQLALHDLLYSERFFHYIQQVGNGRFKPRVMDDEWFIFPERFDRVAVLEQVEQPGLSMAEVLRHMPPPHGGYRRLRERLAAYRTLAAQGGWPSLEAGPTLTPGARDARVPPLRKRLRISGDLTSDELPAADEYFDQALRSALIRFQRRHGLLADGRLGPKTREALNVPVEQRIRQLLINMERWRWLPRHTEPKYLLVNMAGFELQAFERGQAVMNMRVIVGRDYRQTPVFNTRLDALVVNPYWYVPPTVLKEDMLPRLKRDPGHLRRMGIRLFSKQEGQDKEIAAETVDWSLLDGERFPYILRQDPGPGNALGSYKFLLPNPYGIYFHDTPNHALFKRTVRAYSSGCVRLEDPVALAEYLFQDDADINREYLQSLNGETWPRRLKLKSSVPVYLVYWTAWVDSDGMLHFRDDIYGRDTRLLKAVGEDALLPIEPANPNPES